MSVRRALLRFAGAVGLLLAFGARTGATAPDGGVATAPAEGASSPRSPAVYPPRLGDRGFSHTAHARSGAPCSVCHPGAVTSTRASDRLGPSRGDCSSCHLTGPASPAVAPRDGGLAGLPEMLPPPPSQIPGLKFSHKLHVSQGMACTSCHPDSQLDDAGHAALPLMRDCLTCHDGKRASAKCSACHPTLTDGRLRTDFPQGALIPSGTWEGDAVHGPDFRRSHGPVSRDGKRCETCHLRSFCTDCHSEGVVRPAFLHPANYVDLHAFEARRNVPDCAACHRAQSFCVGCHQRLGVAPDAPGGQRGQPAANPFGTGTGLKRFHPPGWVQAAPGGASSGHAAEAHRNITSCASCHREESCLGCHSADPSRISQINPHEPGFAGSARCRALASRNQRACLKCHAPGATALSCF